MRVQLPDLKNVPVGLRDILWNLPKSFLVGGCVRDMLLGVSPKDYDVEVFGTTYDQLKDQLARFGRVDLVGKSFGVIKLTSNGEVYDFAIPRRENRVGVGHRGFAVRHDADITMEQAASRRDFTINALFMDPRTGKIIDTAGGLNDLKGRMLRHTSDAFSEDPLRVLRAMQFASRFEMTVHPETVKLCQSIRGRFSELTQPRIWEEWSKWATKSAVPSKGLLFLQESGWLSHFSEIESLVGVQQDPRHHPEGDAFIHTCHCCDALAQRPEWQEAPAEQKLNLMLAVLTHDFGKPGNTQIEASGRITSHGHDKAGVPIAKQFLDSIGAPNQVKERVLPLVEYHMARFPEATPRIVRRLAVKLHPASLEDLFLVMTADHFGRPPKPRVQPASHLRLMELARQLQVQEKKPEPVLKGRHLLARGMTPGPAFGQILNEAFEAQIDGSFQDEKGAQDWLNNRLSSEVKSNETQSAREFSSL